MEITNTVTIMTEATFAPMESVALVSMFDEEFSTFMRTNPDVYIGSVVASTDDRLCRYIFIVPEHDQKAIEDAKDMVQMLNEYRETTDSLKNR